MNRPPVLFISYSHDSPRHREWVLQLSQRLRDDGFETRLDQYVNGTPDEGWQRWLLNQLDTADFVLIVCSEPYYRRFRGQEQPGKSGFDSETALIRQEMYDHLGQTVKFIPVLRNVDARAYIPEPLRAFTWYALDSAASYADMLSFMEGTAGVTPRPVAERWPDERRPAAPLTFNDATQAENRNRLVHLPFPSLGDFFKREGFLQRLRDSRQTARGPVAIVPQVIVGMGGVGKTRLAVEYAWRHVADYTAVLFVTVDTPETLLRNFAELASPNVLDLPEAQTAEEDVRFAAVMNWLHSNAGWLLILDSVDTKEAATAAEQLWPKLQGGQVLITSRRTNWIAHVELLELDVLDDDVAAELLLLNTQPSEGGRGRKTLKSDPQDAQTLAQELGGLPLALELAGAYIRQNRLSLIDYLQLLRSDLQKVSNWHDTHSNQTLSNAVSRTLDLLSADEIMLLNVLAWFAPDPIPTSVLDHFSRTPMPEDQQQVARSRKKKASAKRRKKKEKDSKNASVESGSAEASSSQTASDSESDESIVELDARSLLANLADVSMVRWDGETDSVTVHRVVQQILRAGQADPIPLLKMTLDMLVKARPDGDPGDVRTWPAWERLQSHVSMAVSEAAERDMPEPTTELMRALASFLAGKALYADAEALQQQALAIDERHHGSNSPEVAMCLSNLALTLGTTNRLSEAEPLMRRALAISEKSRGRNHPSLAVRLNNLAMLLSAINRLAEAERLIRRALAIAQKSLGMGHPNVALYLNNLAVLLQDTNRLAEAEPLLHRALVIDEESFGTDHPNVARDLNNLALLLKVTNRLAEAESLMRRALVIDEEFFGTDHPYVAIDLNNLARLFMETNRAADAEPLARRAIAIHEATFGPTHPRLADALVTLTEIRVQMGEPAKAEEHARRALAIDEASFGAEHPKVARDLDVIAELLLKQQSFDAAEETVRRAVAISEQPPGPEHPDHARDLCTLAEICIATDRGKEADPLLERAHKIYVSSFDNQHPKTQRAAELLAAVRGESKAPQERLEVPDLVTLVYRMVVARQAPPRMLETLQAREIRAVAERLCKDSRQPLRDADDLLNEKLHGLRPPVVWEAWMRTVHEDRMLRLKDEVQQ